jgi:hypothetical protein
LCVALRALGHSGRARYGNLRARGQGQGLYEGPPNSRSAHHVQFNRRRRIDKLPARDPGRLDRPREGGRPRNIGREAAEFSIDRFGPIANLWGLYSLQRDRKAVARGINSIQAIRGAGGWRIAGIIVPPESDAAPLPEEYLP